MTIAFVGTSTKLYLRRNKAISKANYHFVDSKNYTKLRLAQASEPVYDVVGSDAVFLSPAKPFVHTPAFKIFCSPHFCRGKP